MLCQIAVIIFWLKNGTLSAMLNKFARVEKVRVAIYKFLSQVTVNFY